MANNIVYKKLYPLTSEQIEDNIAKYHNPFGEGTAPREELQNLVNNKMVNKEPQHAKGGASE